MQGGPVSVVMWKQQTLPRPLSTCLMHEIGNWRNWFLLGPYFSHISPKITPKHLGCFLQTAHPESLHGATPAAHGELRQVPELVLPHLLCGAARSPHPPDRTGAHRGAALRRIRRAATAWKIPGTSVQKFAFIGLSDYGTHTTYFVQRCTLQLSGR